MLVRDLTPYKVKESKFHKAIQIVAGFIIAFVFAFILVTMAFSVYASSDLNESYETYSLGEISDDPDWTTSTDSCIVSTDNALVGSKSLRDNTSAGSGCDVTHHLNSTTTQGQITIWFYAEEANWVAQYELGWQIGLYINAADEVFLNVNPPGADKIMEYSYAENVWHSVDIQWDKTNDWVRARMNSGAWTATTTAAGFDVTSVRITMNPQAGGVEGFYFDNISYNLVGDSTYCATYETQGVCNADPYCTWWFSQVFYDGGLFPYEGCVVSSTIPTDYDDWDDPYPDEAACVSAGYYWQVGIGCYSSTVDATLDVSIYDNFWDVVKDPEGFLNKVLAAFDFRKKPPFSWVLEIYDIFYTELDRIDEYDADLGVFAPVDIYLGDVIGTTSVTFISFTWITDFFPTQFALLRQMIGYFLWIGFAFYIFNRVRRFTDTLQH